MDSYMDDIVYAELRERQERVKNLETAWNSAKAELKAKQESLANSANDDSTDPALLAVHLNELQSGIRESTAQQTTIRLELAKAVADLASHEERIKATKDMAISPAAVEAALKADAKAQTLQKIIEHCQDVIDDFELKAPGQPFPSLTAMRRRIQKSQ